MAAGLTWSALYIAALCPALRLLFRFAQCRFGRAQRFVKTVKFPVGLMLWRAIVEMPPLCAASRALRQEAPPRRIFRAEAAFIPCLPCGKSANRSRLALASQSTSRREFQGGGAAALGSEITPIAARGRRAL